MITVIRASPYTAVGAVAFVVLSVCFCLRRDSEWETVFLPAATRLWRGEDFYSSPEGYLYPPFMAWTALPFLALPSSAARLGWLVINLACLAGMLRWGWRLAGGGRLEGPVRAPAAEHLAAIAGCVCGIFFIQNCLAHQQTDVVLGALLAGGCLLLGRRRALAAATCFGLVAAAKCTALLFVPYLLWRRRSVAAAWLLCVAVGVNLLPELVSRAPAGRLWLAEYAVRFLKPLTAPDHIVGSWGSMPVYNQSLSGAGQRWCTTTWVWDAADCRIETRANLLSPLLLRIAVHGCQAVLLLGVLWTCGRPFRPIADEPTGQGQALECSLVLLLMLLLSPMSSKAHFGTLLVPGYCLARAAAVSRSRLLWALVLTAAGMGLLCNKDLLGERLYTLSLWYGVVTWETLVLLVGCLIAVRRGSSPPLPCLARVGRIGKLSHTAGLTRPLALPRSA